MREGQLKWITDEWDCSAKRSHKMGVSAENAEKPNYRQKFVLIIEAKGRRT